MSSVNVTSVRILNNPALFTDALQFEIEYECLVNLQDDLEWSVVYVGSAETDKYDQTLESVAVGPVSAGNFRFVLEANPPDHSQIPADDIVGVTVLILSCKYRNQEFIRIGYYVNNEYVTEELKENPPELPDIAQLSRTVLADHPRVTRFPIPFDEAPVDLPLDPSLTADLTMDEMAQDGGMGDGYGGQQLYGSGGMGEDADMGGGVYGSGEQGGMGQQAGGFTFAPPMASMAT